MPASTPIPDRPAALDRYAQMQAVSVALSVALEAAELRELTEIDHDTPEQIANVSDLLLALWPIETIEDERARDESSEYQATDARADVLAAKLLLRIADEAAALRSQAGTLLGIAQHELAAKGGDN